jgi:hypothetical protein
MLILKVGSEFDEHFPDQDFQPMVVCSLGSSQVLGRVVVRDKRYRDVSKRRSRTGDVTANGGFQFYLS